MISVSSNHISRYPNRFFLSTRPGELERDYKRRSDSTWNSSCFVRLIYSLIFEFSKIIDLQRSNFSSTECLDLPQQCSLNYYSSSLCSLLSSQQLLKLTGAGAVTAGAACKISLVWSGLVSHRRFFSLAMVAMAGVTHTTAMAGACGVVKQLDGE